MKYLVLPFADKHRQKLAVKKCSTGNCNNAVIARVSDLKRGRYKDAPCNVCYEKQMREAFVGTKTTIYKLKSKTI